MDVTVIRSKRRTVSIQVNPDLSVTVRAPLRATKRDIERILADRDAWIGKHQDTIRQKMSELDETEVAPLSDAEIRELADKAKVYIPARVAYYAKVLGVTYGRITIRNQKTRWGSCSVRGNLNFNCLLMLAPNEVIDYVVVHELCHRKQMNHSAAFWNEVAHIYPEYKEARKWLRNEGNILMRRIGW